MARTTRSNPSGAPPKSGAKHRKKGDLPTKTCATCGLPFTWRKKWAKDWDQVRYCSDRCRSASKKVNTNSG